MAVSLFTQKLLYRGGLLTPIHRHCYYILLPETGQTDDASTNPLLRDNYFPKFNEITTDKCVSAVCVQALEYENGLKTLEDSLKSSGSSPKNLFADVLDHVEKIGAPLEASWGLMKALYVTNENLMPQKCYMGIHDRARSVHSLKYASLPIYNACKELNDDAKTEEQKRVVQKFLLEGRLNGLDLEKKQKENLTFLQQKVAKAKSEFRGKLEVATNQFKHTIGDSSLMKDFPEDLLTAIAADRSQPNRGPWTVTLQPNIANEFLEHCPDRDIRWNVWQALVLRCSTHTNSSLENSTVIQELRKGRRNLAKLLGYEKYADFSMETKMAGSVEKVKKTMNYLLDKARPAQVEELLQLEAFAAEQGFEGPMQVWDVPFWKTQQQKVEFGVSEETIRDYFPFPKVQSRLLSLCEELFGLQFERRADADVWHPDVEFYNILEPGSKQPVASFYLDPYAREGEKMSFYGSSGWMVPMVNKCDVANKKPLAALVFNFKQPLYGKPSLLTFGEVEHLFRGFGHAMQHLLSQASYSEVSGLSNLEWDAVEISGNVMMNWLHQPSFVQTLCSHYETGECLSLPVLERLCRLRHHMAGYELCRELYLSALDLELHSSTEFWVDVMQHVWSQHCVLPLEKKDSHPCSFTAIFSEDWAAGYYSHLWARLVAADVFSAFTEAGLDNTEECQRIGQRFRSTYLALGGACNANEVFRRFRGRDPSANALLRSLGLKKPKAAPTT